MHTAPLSGGSTEASSVNSRLRSTGQRSARARVLVVEDERDIADLIKHALERGGDIDVEIASSGDAALKAAAAQPPTSSCST